MADLKFPPSKRWQWVLDLNLKAGPKAVLFALAYHADQVILYCFPGLELLSRETGMSERAIQNHMKLLKRKKLISMRSGEGRTNTSQYYLHIPKQYASNYSSKAEIKKLTRQIYQANHSNINEIGETVGCVARSGEGLHEYKARLVTFIKENHV